MSKIQPHHPRKLQPRVKAIISYVATALLTLVVLFYFYGLWGKSLRVPIVPPQGDYVASAMFAKTSMQTGWCASNPHLGAPQSFECYDFPMDDGLNFAFFAIFGRFSNDVILGVNLHYILGYLLIALTSLFAFRQFGFSTLPSISASLLYAFLPYHYLRAEYHLFLSAYYLIPLMILVIFWIYNGECLFRRVSERGWQFRLTKKGVGAVVICLLMGSGGVYYAAFALVFLAVTTVLVVSRTKSASAFIAPAVAGLLVLTAVFVNLSPDLWYFHVNGQDQEVAHRQASEAEAYGLKITNLLLPIANHRLPSFARSKLNYLRQAHGGEGAEGLGIVGGLGFLILIVSIFWARLDGPPGILSLLGRLNIAAVLAATVGGFGSLFNFLFFPEIRVYARMSVYIGFFSLGAVLCLVRWSALRLGAIRDRPLLFNVAAAILLFTGLWDLLPYPQALQAGARFSYQSERNFVQRIESMLPRGAMIYQLPYMPYPESGPLEQMLAYDPAHGYLYSNNLRWSYGATKGRPAAEWQQHEADLPPRDLLPSLKLIGFAGIWIDSFGYTDRAVALSSQIKELLNIEPLRSADARFLFFPITGYRPPDSGNVTPEERASLLETAIALPAPVSFAHCSGLERRGDINWHWCGLTGEIQIRNLNTKTAAYKLTMTLQTAYTNPSSFHFRGDLGSGDIQANVTGTAVVKDLKLSPGLHTFRIESDAPRVVAPGDPRDMHFAIVDFQLTAE